MKLYVLMRLKNLKNTNNLFKRLFLVHPTYVLCKIDVRKCSYKFKNSKGTI
jgi:hypothetical protein